MTDRNAHILQLARWGYQLVPWHARATPSSPSSPLITGWLETKLTYEEIHAHVRLRPNADWAIVPQETVVLDLENKHGLTGEADIARVAEDCGISWAALTSGCAQTRTKSGGLHLWFRQPHGTPLVGGCHIRPSIECKSGNGSVHIPPSCGYTEIVRLGTPAGLPALPRGLCDLWRSAAAPRKGRQAELRERFGEGERRLMMCRVAGKLRQSIAMNEPELYAAMLAIRDERCDDPTSFTDDEIKGIAHDYARKTCDDLDALCLAGNPEAEALQRLFTRRFTVRANAAVSNVARMA